MTEDCSNLETDLLSEFHYFEKLKLQVKKQAESKSASQSFILTTQTDFDPNLKNKYEAIKKLHAYIQRELPTLNAFKEAKKRELKEKMNNNVPLYEIYDMIKAINMNIKYHNGQINKIIEKLKFARLGRTVFKGSFFFLYSMNKILPD